MLYLFYYFFFHFNPLPHFLNSWIIDMFCHIWSHFCFLSQGSIWWSRLDPPVQLPHWWDYRHAPLCPTYSWVLVSPPFFPSSFPPPFPSPFSLRLGLTVLFSLNPKLLVLLPQPQSSAGSQPVLPGTMFLMESASGVGWGQWWGGRREFKPRLALVILLPLLCCQGEFSKILFSCF